MARLIPNIDVAEIALKPERDVAQVLVDQLPDEVRVFHSYPWLRPDRNDRTGKVTLREGEADFLILWPELGFLVLEVKGGDIEYGAESRRWYRKLPNGGERDIQDPFEQANKNLHEIVGRMKEKEYHGKNPPFSFGYAAVFPDCKYDGEMPPGADPAICLSAGDLGQMDKRLRRALKSWSRSDPPKAIGDGDMDKVMRVVLPEFRILPVLFRTIEEQEEALFRLTEDQARLLEFLGTNSRAAIEGVAGSGKTMLALAQAGRFAAEDKKTLLVCYNKTLASWLRNSIPADYKELIEVFHFHALCSEWCRRAGITFNPGGGGDDFWTHEASELFWQAVDAMEDRFDAVVVDEGQDFAPDWWEPLALINKDTDEGNFYVFYDPAQNLYNEEGSSIPALGEPFVLPLNCRNTRSIAHTAGEVLHQEIATHPRAPLGIDTEVIHEEVGEGVAKYIEGWIKEWVKKQGIRPSQIVIMSPFKQMNSHLRHHHHFSGVSLTEDLDEWRADKGILYTTIRSFKGLESDIAVLVDVVDPGSLDMFTRADLYVACSRAKHVLKILSRVEPGRLFDTDGAENGG